MRGSGIVVAAARFSAAQKRSGDTPGALPLTHDMTPRRLRVADTHQRESGMRVLAIAGSLRAASINSALLRVAAPLAPPGLEVLDFVWGSLMGERASNELGDGHELLPELLGQSFESSLFGLQDLRVVVGHTDSNVCSG